MAASEAPQRGHLDEGLAPLALLAATSRNATARFLHASAIAVVVGCVLGPLLATFWFATVCVMGAWINAVVKTLPVDQGRETTGWPVPCLITANFVNTATTAFICAALWTQADPVSRFCAVAISAVSGTHTLLRFGPHTGLLALFLAPIVVAMAYVAVDTLGVPAHASILPIVALTAVFICLVNFLAGARRQIIADRDELVHA